MEILRYMVFMLQRYSYNSTTGDHLKINASIDILEKINFASLDLLSNLKIKLQTLKSNLPNVSAKKNLTEIFSPGTKFKSLR